MRHILTIAFSFCLVMNIHSQVFYDKDFQKLNGKEGAIYYKTIDTTQFDIVEKTYYFDDSVLCEQVHYSLSKERVKQGKSYQYYDSGKLKYEMEYIDNRLHGCFKGYYENGQLKRTDKYQKDTLIEGKCYTEAGKDTSYYVLYKDASYLGKSDREFRRFVEWKAKYPSSAVNKRIQGRVEVQFTVDTNGKVVDIKILKSPNELLSQSAIRAVKKCKMWEPCIYEGKKVKQKFVIPIVYEL